MPGSRFPPSALDQGKLLKRITCCADAFSDTTVLELFTSNGLDDANFQFTAEINA